VVHDLADRRISRRGDLDQVETLLAGNLKRLGKGLDPELRSVGSDQADLTSADAIVDAGVVRGDCGITSRG